MLQKLTQYIKLTNNKRNDFNALTFYPTSAAYNIIPYISYAKNSRVVAFTLNKDGQNTLNLFQGNHDMLSITLSLSKK